VTHKVRFRASAETDLFALYEYIAEISGRKIAGDYIGRIEAACLQLEMFPERGTRRDDMAPGIRTFGIGRRVTVAFRVLADTVEIVAIAYGGRDFRTEVSEDE
jgi:toxin ParE1/3/4